MVKQEYIELILDLTEVGLNPKYIGSSVDDWLVEEGILEEVHKLALEELAKND